MTGVPASSHGASASAILLASATYAPAGLATYNLTTAPLAALDTTNLTLAFTVPANGRVLFRATTYVAKAATTDALGLGLLNHSGGAQVGVTANGFPGAFTNSQVVSVAWLLTGLTAGALQLDLAAGAVTSGTCKVFAQGATGNVSGSNSGPAVLEAWAA